jgi:iron complex outermembrane receptor protein
MSSYFLSGGYVNDKTMVKAVVFSGRERTFQSWYGTPQSRLENDVDGMIAHAEREGFNQAQLDNLLNSGRTYNFYLYENEVDDYRQDHYQLHASHAFRTWIKFTGSLHYTYGNGFFEQFREDDEFSDYGVPNVVIGNDTITSTDIVRRRWLDNHFYGGTYALNLNKGRHNVILGGGIHIYRGDHFGEIIWAAQAGDIAPGQRYYFNYGNKDEYNNYLKWDYTAGRWGLMADAQLRIVSYETAGIDNDITPFDISQEFLFFNPKAGVRYTINSVSSVYGYAGVGNREPVRNDFVDAVPGITPKHETLYNFELGYTYKNDRLKANVNGYLMMYQNQLVLTGQLNDVGASVRSNVENSYRAGVEGDATLIITEKILLNANLTLSENKIRKYVEVLYDYTDGFDVVEETFINTDISFSPSVIGASTLILKPFKNSEIAIITKYVGRQYLDNTQNSSRSLDAFSTTDVKLGYLIKSTLFKEVEISLLVNNIFNAMYSSNGYTYSYVVGDRVTENFFYPQAGINFLTGITLRF